MKRLPFALIALSLSIPAVACLNGAAEEDAVSGEDELSQETKASCNFAFKEVPNAVKKAAGDAAGVQLKLSSSFGITSGQRLVWGDFNGDGKKDFAFSPGNREIQVYLGDANTPGGFVRSKTSAKFPEVDGRTRTAIALVSTGDFDGDGKSDLVAIASYKESPEGSVAVFYGAAVDASLEAPKTLPTLSNPITSATHYHESGDLDGDGKDDLVITTDNGEIVAFGAADRTLTAAPSGFDSARVRSLAFISPKAGDKAAQLIIATPKEIATITYDAEHKATVSTKPYDFGAGTSRWIGTKLDAKSKNNGDIAILGNSGLSVIPVTATQAKKASLWEGVPGEMIGALDFDGNEEQELLYKVDDNKLFAACGAGKAAKDIVAAPLDIPYGKDLIVAGRIDLDGDKKADLVTLDISAEAAGGSRGTVKVYLSNGKADPAPALQTFAAPAAPVVDAGAPAVDATVATDSSSPTVDATAPVTDAGVKDSGTTTATDSGAPKVDAGVDSGAPKTDAGTGPGPKKDAGTAAPEDGDDDDDDSETTPPDDEGTGTKNDKPKKPAKPSTNGATTGNSNVSIIPKPVATDDGCSTTGAPGSGGLSTSAFGGLAAAMMLLARRRRNKKA